MPSCMQFIGIHREGDFTNFMLWISCGMFSILLWPPVNCIKIAKQLHKSSTIRFSSSLHNPCFTMFTATTKQQAGDWVILHQNPHHFGMQSLQRFLFSPPIIISSRATSCRTLEFQRTPLRKCDLKVTGYLLTITLNKQKIRTMKSGALKVLPSF